MRESVPSERGAPRSASFVSPGCSAPRGVAPLLSGASVAVDTYKIRPARRGDREPIASLLAEAGYPDSCDTTTLSWVISHPEMEVHLAVDALDRAVGMVSLSHRPQLRLKGRIATIDELVVASAWRKRGIGKELLLRAISRARTLGCKRIDVDSLDGTGGPEFLQKCGFKRVGASLLRLET